MSRGLYLLVIGIIAFGIQPALAQQTADTTNTAPEVFVAEDPPAVDAETVNTDTEPVLAEEETPVTTEEAPSDIPAADAETQPALAEEDTPTATEEAPDTVPAVDTEAQPAALAEEDTPVATEEAPSDIPAAAAEAQPALAEEATPTATEEAPDTVPAAAAEAEEDTSAETQEEIPDKIRNNRYFLESQRLAKLAEETYKYGDYDASSGFAEEALRYAQLSDEYVARQMKIKAANEAIAAAKSRIDWALSSGTSKQYPAEFSEAEGWYNESLAARKAEEWNNAIDAANKVINILAYIEDPNGAPLPATYTVRTWISFRDCFWNIAARPWVYGDPRQWRFLYNANKAKLPNPNNANLIEPGMVIDIPSLQGETRAGSWDENRTYKPIH